MKKHENFLVHRDVNHIDVNDEGGIIIKFTDESHTYLPPFFLRMILRNCFDDLDEIQKFIDIEE